MTSTIAETLSAAGLDGGERCTANLDQLSTQSDELRLDVMTFLKSKYEDFDAWLDKTSSLFKRHEQLHTSMRSTSQLIQSQLEAKRQPAGYAGATAELDKVTETLHVLELLLEAHKLQQLMQEQLAQKDYCESSSSLSKMKDCLDRLDHGPPGLTIVKALRVEQTLLAETLRQAMTDDWISFMRVSKPNSSSEEDNIVTFTINKSKSSDRLVGLYKTLHSEGLLKLRLKPLAEAITLCFDWIVNHPKTSVTEELTDVSMCLTVTRTTKSVSPSAPSVVFKSLYNLIKSLAGCLQATFNINDANTSLMSELSSVCGSRPIDIVIKGCLSPSVPTSQSDLNKYRDVAGSTEKLQVFFAKVGFLTTESESMISYMSNLDVLFANKKCQQILSEARQLMKADLYKTIQLEPGDDCANWSSFVAKAETSEGSGDTNSNLQSRMAKLSENTLKFPSCAISETTVDLMKLAHSMLEEACGSSNAACCSQIVYAVRSMFELYTSVVPDFHHDGIESLPQMTALYYNNCMFLSHQLILLASQYKARLTKVMNDGSGVTFVDLVSLLRALGTQSFLDQLHSQKLNLLDCLKGAEGFKSVEVEERFGAASQSVRQCLHQLSHLKKVWVDVLPLSNYCKAIGHLLGCVVKEMTISIQALEDMSANDTTKLDYLIKQVLDAAPDLFPGDRAGALGYLHKNTAGWSRLHELSIVLTSSLHDVLDRWADGKGPLAAEFTPEQVKSFIRALFQNTDRRAAAISKIY
ncbi:centromere/kinetochore protein zw10 homolog [Watersipora subatra]|uniref:centromere/kinetochore protein zw10 homolog n=1 Tax=Watersipora subatra TaxID=2589382 RepID=UPI00355B1ACF